ncbi:hypothetical protein COI71_32030, partial [Bacillus cereus]
NYILVIGEKVEMNEGSTLKKKIIATLPAKEQAYKIAENFLVILLLATTLFTLEGLLDEKIYTLSIGLNEIINFVNSHWFGFSILIPMALFLIYVLIKK